MARACPLFLHMCAVLEMRRGRKVEISGIYYSLLMARTSWKLRKRAKGTWHFTIGSNSRNYKINLRKQPTFGEATSGFPRQMTSEKRAQKFHSDDASLPRSG